MLLNIMRLVDSCFSNLIVTKLKQSSALNETELRVSDEVVIDLCSSVTFAAAASIGIVTSTPIGSNAAADRYWA